MPSLAHYVAQYDHEHLFLQLLMRWIWAAALFLGGWVLLFLGKRTEGKSAFFEGPTYRLVRPISGSKISLNVLTGTHRKPAPEGAIESTADA